MRWRRNTLGTCILCHTKQNTYCVRTVYTMKTNGTYEPQSNGFDARPLTGRRPTTSICASTMLDAGRVKEATNHKLTNTNRGPRGSITVH